MFVRYPDWSSFVQQPSELDIKQCNVGLSTQGGGSTAAQGEGEQLPPLISRVQVLICLC